MPIPEARTVVIVEDDSGMSHAIERIVRLAGFTPMVFSSAEALLQSRGASDAGCLIFDVHLPGLSGFQLRQRLVAMGHSAPVIFITAYDEAESREQAASAGALALLIKPFAGDALVEKVTCAMGMPASQ